MSNKRGEYKIKKEHIIKLDKLYNKIILEKEKEKKDVNNESIDKCWSNC